MDVHESGSDGERAEILRRSLEAIAGLSPQDQKLGGLLERYYADSALEDLRDRDPLDIVGAFMSHVRLAQVRRRGESLVHAFTPTVELNGWSGGHSVIDIITDDMPFIVDSVMAAVTSHGHGIHTMTHPVLVVRRGAGGELEEVLETGAESTDSIVESWIHIDINRESDQARLDDLEVSVQGVLGEVRLAVEDWQAMKRRAQDLVDEFLSQPPAGVPDADVEEAQALLTWMGKGNFTFLGFREYLVEGEEGEPDERLVSVPESGLGILRDTKPRTRYFSDSPPAVRRKAREPRILVLTKANTRSKVHRPVYMDYIGIKKFDDVGNVVGERRFLGLFASSAYTQSVFQIPVARRTALETLSICNYATGSHSAKDVEAFLETYPRDEMFEVTAQDLVPVARTVMRRRERRQVSVFVRCDTYGRFVTVLVYLPRDRYTTAVRMAIQSIIRERFDATELDYTANVGQSQSARLQFMVRVPRPVERGDVDQAELEAEIAQAVRSWDDDFSDVLHAEVGEERAAAIQSMYLASIPESYKEATNPRTAVSDIRRLSDLADTDPDAEDLTEVNLYEPLDTHAGMRFKVIRVGPPLALPEILPILTSMGAEVVDERPFAMGAAGGDGRAGWVYDFGVVLPEIRRSDTESFRARFCELCMQVWAGAVETDGLNSLVVHAGLDWREITWIRAIVNYARQLGTHFSLGYLEETLRDNGDLVAALLERLRAAHDPALADADRPAAMAQADALLDSAMEGIESLDLYRIMQLLLGIVRAAVRTNAFAQMDGRDGGGQGAGQGALAFKFDSALVPQAPEPRPKYETWVMSPRVAGVHLRFGLVSRGGIRWSDRQEDFRTEVLGLVKAQMVKNAVIVPVGAKGGFVVRGLPRGSTREEIAAAGLDSYREFIRGLLDITDNIVDDEIVPPAGVVRHDGDDPYLVVAADKGTSSFSDEANAISLEREFWLGDAFASGGSAGYDHKKMGITARGAWESVRRHFRELGVDTQADEFTVVGVGDMSGDVFGNGMLLSRHIRLVAAFDHRHIFLDPQPDTTASLAERRRMFELPRSSWMDFDPEVISPGGGVYSRTARSIELSPQIRAVLDIEVEELSPPELVRAILSAPVDLLWNGGIGTFVRAHDESDLEVGDKANDAIRIDALRLRARVVGEGGNLGLTQRGRVEAARNGVRLNTDAIDNSAGVDASDHEVNIKILLDAVVRRDELTRAQRNDLLESMTSDVADLVLRDNYQQNFVLGAARASAVDLAAVHERFMCHLERVMSLDRQLEALPTAVGMQERIDMGEGLSSPELSVLLAHAKISLVRELSETSLTDEKWYRYELQRYFPHVLQERYGKHIESHRLHKEIVSTCIANSIVNRGGITFAFRVAEETGASALEIVRAATASMEVFDIERVLHRITELDNRIPTRAQDALALETRRLLDRATRWFIAARGAQLDVAGEIDSLRPIVRELAEVVPELLVGVEKASLEARASAFASLGAPAELAREVASLLDAYTLLDIAEVSKNTGAPASTVAHIAFAISERFDVDRLLRRITTLPRNDRWETLARSAMRSDLYRILASLTKDVVMTTSAELGTQERILAWESSQAEGIARTKTTLAELWTAAGVDGLSVETGRLSSAMLSVALQSLRTLVKTA